MEVAMAQYPPGDPRLVDKIVGQLKSQGIFDRFRRECIADVDTKPAYQNLHQRVETSVSAFLAKQEWKSDLNKNQVRDSLRKHIHESGFLDIGVERIVDQVVNPKIMPVFLPQIEDVVYSCLGIEKPKKNKENFNVTMCPPPIKQPAEKKPEPLQVLSEMLPKDLDPISPESDTFKDDDDEEEEEEDDDDDDLINNVDEHDKNKVTEEEESSPPFEPIGGIHSNHDSNDSHLSEISGPTSEDSQISHISFSKHKKDALTPACPVSDIASQDSQLSKVSSNSRLSMELSDEHKDSSKVLVNDNKEGTFSQILDDSSNPKFAGITSFSQQHIFGHSPIVTKHHQDKNKDSQINEAFGSKQLQTNKNSNIDQLQKCEFDFPDSANVQAEDTAKSCTDESDSKSHLDVGIESCDASDAELTTAKTENKISIFANMFTENKSENQNSPKNKSENDYNWESNLKSNEEFLGVCEESRMLDKRTDDFVKDNVCEISCSEGNPYLPCVPDIKQENVVSASSTCFNFKTEETVSSVLKENSLDGYNRITEHVDIKSDTRFDTDTDTKDSQPLPSIHHYESIQESFNTNNSQIIIENFNDHDGEGEKLSSMDIPTGEETQECKLYIKEDHSTKQNKCETEVKNEIVMLCQKGGSLEEVTARKENMKVPSKELGKKEQSKDNSQGDRYTKDGSKERSRSEKEINRDRNRHDKLSKDSSKEHLKHDDRKAKEGSKDRSKRDDSKERTKQNEGKERSKRDDKTDKEMSKDKHKHEEKSDRERSRHESKSEKDKARDHSRHDEKSDRNASKERKEVNKENSKREKTREKDDRTSKTSEKDKGKQEEKNDKHKIKADEKSKCEKDKARNENSSSRPANQDAEHKEKHKSDSKRSKDKHKHDKSKYVSDGKSRKASDDKSEKERTNKEDSREKLRDQPKTDSVVSAEKSHRDKQKIHEKDRKGHDKSRESSSSSSSRKSERKTENSKSQRSESKDKEKKKENKNKTAPDDHFIHRDKNSEDRRSTDRDSNGTSCDKSRGKGTESQSSQKQEKKSSRQNSTGKTEGGASESPDTNAKSEECNEGDSPSKSPGSSPSSLLPFKKRPLHQHSETDDELDEYSCSSDSGKLILKLKKPKIAANIFEIKKIMQLRKSMAKLEHRNRYHNGKHSEVKGLTVKQPNDAELLDTVGNREGGLQSSSSVDFQTADYEDVLLNDEDNVVTQEDIPLPSEEPILQNTKQNMHMYTENEAVSGTGLKDKAEYSLSESDGYENSDVDSELTYFEQSSATQTESLSAYLRTYEENLYSDPVCFTDCSGSDNEEMPATHSLSHLKCKIVKEIIDEYVHQHYGFDSNLTVSVTEANTSIKALRAKEIADKTNHIPAPSKSHPITGKDLPDRVPKTLRRSKCDGTSITGNSFPKQSHQSVRTGIDNSDTEPYETKKNPMETDKSFSELNHAKVHASVTTKKLPKGYVLEWVPISATEADNSNNNAVQARKGYIKKNSGGDKEQTTVNTYKQVNTEQCIDKIQSTSTEETLERVSVSGPVQEVHEIPHFISGSDNTPAVNCTSYNGPDNHYVIADSDEDEYVGGEKYNLDNNIDKSSSDDEKVPLSADLIFHSLRDLMLESGMQKRLSPEKVISIAENHPKPASEPRRNLLGRSRRPGLSRPAPGKGVAMDNSNSRTSTPDFVMPLSPESDVSASSGEQSKKLMDSREAGNIADSGVSSNLNQEDSEGKRTLRSATAAYRGQRYSSDELYKPRPLFHVTSRRVKSKQQSSPPSEEVTVKKRRSTVEGCESSHSEKGTYR